ncbi:MAG: hypothetical protein Fur0025_23660 [Oscillatoriaceae cyanobacterium]
MQKEAKDYKGRLHQITEEKTALSYIDAGKVAINLLDWNLDILADDREGKKDLSLRRNKRSRLGVTVELVSQSSGSGERFGGHLHRSGEIIASLLTIDLAL